MVIEQGQYDNNVDTNTFEEKEENDGDGDDGDAIVIRQLLKSTHVLNKIFFTMMVMVML